MLWKSWFKRQAPSTAKAAIYLSRDAIAFAIEDQGSLRVGRKPIELENAASGDGVFGVLAETVQEWIAQERLVGASVSVALSGDLCVTRVAAGPTSTVESEIREIEQRSTLYLTLGLGPKIIGQSLRAIDAKRSHACITIANEALVERLWRALLQSGARVARIEHSLVATARLLGRMKLDDEGPMMLLEAHPRGVDVGVAFQGSLLLDYRPCAAGETTGEAVGRHFGRIQRHCMRISPSAKGRISKVVLCGDAASVAALSEEFSSESGPQPTTIDLEVACAPLPKPSSVDGGEWMLPLLGALGDGEPGPDLTETLKSRQREPIGPLAAKTFWPIGVAAGVTLLVWLAAMRESSLAASAEAAAKAAKAKQSEMQVVQAEMTAATSQWKSLNHISANVQRPQWDAFMIEIASRMPEGAWLDAVKVDPNGAMFLSGTAYAEDDVYKFVERLKSLDMVSNVALEATRASRTNTGPATMFDLRGNFVGRKADSPRSDPNG